MEYILLIHNNHSTPIAEHQWNSFLAEARASGIFLGGSAIANRIQLGNKDVPSILDTIDGFMRFETNDIEALRTLLQRHPVLLNEGTFELCEMPKT